MEYIRHVAAILFVCSAQTWAGSGQTIPNPGLSSLNAMSDTEVLSEVKRYIPQGVSVTPAQARQILEKMHKMQGVQSLILRAQAQTSANPSLQTTDVPGFVSEDALAVISQ